MNNVTISDKSMEDYLGKAKLGMSCLDLGCGDGYQKQMIEELGYQWTGIDENPCKEGIKGDIHKLPLPKNYFDVVFCRAVLEYSHSPDKMLKEVYRVLKKKGRFVGSVAFLEPYHSSYFHYTHLGLKHILERNNFFVDSIKSSSHWNGIRAIAYMHLFPKFHKFFVNLLILPLMFSYRLYWLIGKLFNKNATKERMARDISGSFVFISHKEFDH